MGKGCILELPSFMRDRFANSHRVRCKTKTHPHPWSNQSPSDWHHTACSLGQTSSGIYAHFITLKNGDVRAILNLKWLNMWMKKPCFKMETPYLILMALRRGDFLGPYTYRSLPAQPDQIFS